MLSAPPPYISKVLNKFIERWKEFNYKVRRFIGSRIPPPPPLRPLGADMLEMTTDAQEGNNKTSQGLINTMQSHSVVKRFEITMIFYWISFIYGLKSPPLQVIMHQRQPWKLFYLQVIKKHLFLKDQCQYIQLHLWRTPLGRLLCVCLREMNAL